VPHPHRRRFRLRMMVHQFGQGEKEEESEDETLRLRLEPPRRAGLCLAGRSIRCHRALRTEDRPAVGRCRRFLLSSRVASRCRPTYLAACDRNDALDPSSRERRQRQAGRQAGQVSFSGGRRVLSSSSSLGIRHRRQDREKEAGPRWGTGPALVGRGPPFVPGKAAREVTEAHGDERRPILGDDWVVDEANGLEQGTWWAPFPCRSDLRICCKIRRTDQRPTSSPHEKSHRFPTKKNLTFTCTCTPCQRPGCRPPARPTSPNLIRTAGNW
jgi:hypothetical protein